MINQPVEVVEVRRQFAAFLGIGDLGPDLVMRLGRGTTPEGKFAYGGLNLSSR